MTRGSLPNTDAGLKDWSTNFAKQLDQNHDQFGISQQQADEYRAMNDLFIEQLRLATEPATRTKPVVAAKNDLRKQLKEMARRYISIINGQPGLADADRVLLGIHVASARTRISQPEEKISLQIVSVHGRRVTFRISGETVRKPKNVYGAVVYTYIGENPENQNDFRFQGITTRNVMSIEFPIEVPAFSMVWLTARWFNPRGVMGEYSKPINTNLQNGLGYTSGLQRETTILKAA